MSIVSLTANPCGIESLSKESLSFFLALVRDRTAIELDPTKQYLIKSRLDPVAKKHGFRSVAELLQVVQARPHSKLAQSVVEAMTTNETSFFRDHHPFVALRTHILPELLERKATQRSLTIWSAACSTGQELYSVAILLKEYFSDLGDWNITLLGTDVSDEVLQRAREAKYTQLEVNRGLPAQLLLKYFQRDGLQWQLHPEVRAMATFRKLNLIDTWPPLPTMDVVLLRNVLIYFSPENKKLILDKVRRVMAPHAYLLLGAAETTLNLSSLFQRLQIDNSVFYRAQ